MTLPVTETLKLILGGPRADAPAGLLHGSGMAVEPRPGLNSGRRERDRRLDALFEALHRVLPDRPADEIEDEIWAIWTGHDDPALEARMQCVIAAIEIGRASCRECAKLPVGGVRLGNKGYEVRP